MNNNNCKEQPKIAILYIATGNYIKFWKDFFLSSEKYFVKDIEKKYFVFTDSSDFKFSKNKNVEVIHQEKLGWPYDTLMRFDMFLKKEEELKNFEYVFFFNANMQFVKNVSASEILPNDANDGLVGGLHPYFKKKNIDEYEYDRNENSKAYIPYGCGKFYIQGCLNGGTSQAYLELCRVCRDNINIDLENEVIAKWHDESHLNKYLCDKSPLLLDKEYLCPETSNIFFRLFKAKIIQRDKSKAKYGGYKYLRGEDKTKTNLSTEEACNG